VRLFIALNLPEEEKSRLHEATAALRADAAGIRWIPSGSIHLTLKFLGEVAETRVNALAARLGDCAAGHVPFTLALGGVGGFPALGRARVWWIGIAPSEPLLRLQAEVENALEAEGFEREARPFSPHLTIGRLPRGGRPVAAARAQEHAAAVRYDGSWRVDSLDLMRSHLRRSGAVYEPVVRLSLSGAP
jgi:RNA 2',3'-cyclic 3'-phosphodiesterase